MSKKSKKSFSSMSDQLKAWSDTHQAPPDGEAPAAAPITTTEGPPEEVLLSDEELFAQAVDAVGDGSVLKKFDDEEAPKKGRTANGQAADAADAPAPSTGRSGASDARLFLDAVDDVNPDNFKKNKS